MEVVDKREAANSVWGGSGDRSWGRQGSVGNDKLSPEYTSESNTSKRKRVSKFGMGEQNVRAKLY